MTKSFDAQLAARRDALNPATRRVIDFVDANRATALASSALDLAAAAATSDATVVRAVRALGFTGLADLKQALVEAVAPPTSAAEGMRRTLDEVGESTDRAIDAVISAHDEGLGMLRRPESKARMAAAVSTLHPCRRIAVFGLGPSQALARYAATQLGRSGRATHLLDVSGRMLADRLLALAPGDGLLAIAYGPAYREVRTTFDEARRVALPTVLMTDGTGGLAAALGGADVVLDVPRGRAERVALHGATLVATECVVLGLSAVDRASTVRGLERLDRLRRALDPRGAS